MDCQFTSNEYDGTNFMNYTSQMDDANFTYPADVPSTQSHYQNSLHSTAHDQALTKPVDSNYDSNLFTDFMDDEAISTENDANPLLSFATTACRSNFGMMVDAQPYQPSMDSFESIDSNPFTAPHDLSLNNFMGDALDDVVPSPTLNLSPIYYNNHSGSSHKRPIQTGTSDLPQPKRQVIADHLGYSPFASSTLPSAISDSMWSGETPQTSPSQSLELDIGLDEDAADVCATWFSKRYAVLPSDHDINALSHLTKASPTAIRHWFGQMLKQGMIGHDSAYKSQSTRAESRTSPQDQTTENSQEPQSSQPTLGHSGTQDTLLTSTRRTTQSGKKTCSPTSNRDLLKRDENKIYQCTRGCGKRYGKKCDWRRNEEEGYPAKHWLCSLCVGTGVERVRPCYRRYHFTQHFNNIHPGLSAADYEADSLVQLDTAFPRRCGFCPKRFTSRNERIDHIAGHFRKGKCMLDWDDSEDDTGDFHDGDDDKPDDDTPGDDSHTGSRGSDRDMQGHPDHGTGLDDDDGGDNNRQDGQCNTFIGRGRDHRTASKDPSWELITAGQPKDDEQPFDSFSLTFFHSSPIEAIPADPEPPLVLEVPLEALDHTGIYSQHTPESNTSTRCFGDSSRSSSSEDLQPLQNRLERSNSQGVLGLDSQSPHLRAQEQPTFNDTMRQSLTLLHIDQQRSKDRCHVPECGRVFKDIEAHMLTHETKRPEKCPIWSCQYQPKSFARKYDKDRLTLADYKATRIGGSCPGSGSRAEKSCTQTDDFKRHTSSVGSPKNIGGSQWISSIRQTSSSTPSSQKGTLNARGELFGNSPSFLSTKLLGTGGFSTVDEVIDRVTNLRICRKTLKNREKSALDELHKEIQILQKLRHPHVIRFLGAYSRGEKLSILLSPVADTTLALWLENCHAQKPQGFEENIFKLFGCLSSAVRYLHEQRPVVKHMDIKPQNILLKENEKGSVHVILTDFGISQTSEDDSVSSGSGPLTRKYAAPEVAKSMSRGSVADIWSLGCVFLEMILVEHDSEDFRKEYSRANYWEDVPRLRWWLHKFIDQANSPRENVVFQTVETMLDEDPTKRPEAGILTLIFKPASCCQAWPNEELFFPGPLEEKEALAEVLLKSKEGVTGQNEKDRIAIVSMSGDYQDAAGQEELKELLQKGLDVLKDFSADRFIDVQDQATQQENGSLQQVKMWLQECSDGHAGCQSHEGDKTLLPSRLIDIQAGLDGSFDGRLITTSHLPSSTNYVALSWSWGKDEIPKLTSDNLQDMLNVVPGEDLPKAITDAISVSQQLGTRYLWVDSLCIIQDSQEDRQKECAKLAHVYRNALLTIVADSATGGTNNDNCSESCISQHASPTMTTDGLLGGSTWETRTWTLQERLLSKRLLHLGEQMYWECNELKASETFPRGLSPLLWESVHSRPQESTKAPYSCKAFSKSFSKPCNDKTNLRKQLQTSLLRQGSLSTSCGLKDELDREDISPQPELTEIIDKLRKEKETIQENGNVGSLASKDGAT